MTAATGPGRKGSAGAQTSSEGQVSAPTVADPHSTRTVLDWSGSHHWSTKLAACLLCGQPTNLRNSRGRPVMKVCAEDLIDRQVRGNHALLARVDAQLPELGDDYARLEAGAELAVEDAVAAGMAGDQA